jgi:hypothetical protein
LLEEIIESDDLSGEDMNNKLFEDFLSLEEVKDEKRAEYDEKMELSPSTIKVFTQNKEAALYSDRNDCLKRNQFISKVIARVRHVLHQFQQCDADMNTYSYDNQFSLLQNLVKNYLPCHSNLNIPYFAILIFSYSKLASLQSLNHVIYLASNFVFLGYSAESTGRVLGDFYHLLGGN